MFEPGDAKPEKSGRRPGTPNKKTQEVQELVAASGMNPILVLIELLSDENKDRKFAAAKELAQYLYPKRKAIDVDLGDSGISVYGPPLTIEQLLELIKMARGDK